MAEQLKLPEIAQRLGVSEKTARRYVKSGALPSVFVGGAYRVSEDELEAFLQGARVTPGHDSPKGSTLPAPQRSFNDVVNERRRSRFAEAISVAADRCVETMTVAGSDPKITAGMVDALTALHETVIAPIENEQHRQALTTEEGDEIFAVAGKLLEAASAGVRRLEEAAEDASQEEEAKRKREKIKEWTSRLSA